MSKKDQIELLVQADENQRKLEEKKIEVKLVEAKEKREFSWVIIIWSVGILILLFIALYGKANSWFF